MVKFAGHTPIYTDLKDGRMDLEDVEKKLPECKAIIINSPSNPTGRVESIKTLKGIERLTKDTDIRIISDEVYKDLIYERENYLIKGPNVITVNSFSKTYAMCGFRIGYLWARDKTLVEKVIDIKSHTSMNTNILGQEMAYTATQVDKSYIIEQVKVWKERRDTIYKGLKSVGLELNKPEGAFYVLPKVKDAEKVMRDLWEKHKVITYLGDWFGAPEHLRLSYALDKEKIEKGIEIIGKYLAEQN
jgi:aspartate aminotransferase